MGKLKECLVYVSYKLKGGRLSTAGCFNVMCHRFFAYSVGHGSRVVVHSWTSQATARPLVACRARKPSAKRDRRSCGDISC